MLKEIIIAIQSYIHAHRFIKKHKLWKWIIIPGIIYTILFVISFILFTKTAYNFIEFFTLKLGLKDWLQRMQSGFLGFLFAFSGMIIFMIQMLLYFSIFKYLFLIISSPIFSYLSEKTEAILDEKEFPFSFKQLLVDVLRGIRIAIRNAGWQTVYMFTILLLGFIPFIGWLTPLLAVIIECYYYGFSMLDYSLERHKKTAAQSIYFIGSHKGLAIGNGLIFYGLHLIPIIGWLFAPAYAVVAATLSLKREKNI